MARHEAIFRALQQPQQPTTNSQQPTFSIPTAEAD